MTFSSYRAAVWNGFVRHVSHLSVFLNILVWSHTTLTLKTHLSCCDSTAVWHYEGWWLKEKSNYSSADYKSFPCCFYINVQLFFIVRSRRFSGLYYSFWVHAVWFPAENTFIIYRSTKFLILGHLNLVGYCKASLQYPLKALNWMQQVFNLSVLSLIYSLVYNRGVQTFFREGQIWSCEDIWGLTAPPDNYLNHKW